MRETSARSRLAATGAPPLTLALRIASSSSAVISPAGRFFHLGSRLDVELPLVFSPAPLVRLGVVVDVSLRELAEREHVARGPLLADGVAALRDLELRFARQLARVGERHGRIAAERRAAFAVACWSR